MSPSTSEHTLLPEHHDEIAALQQFLAAAPNADEPAVLKAPDGTTHTIPAEVHEALMIVIKAMAEGKAVTVAPKNTALTTQEAADAIGVSRPTLVRLLDEGRIPFTRPGRHRRVLLDDILTFRNEQYLRRTAALDALVADSEDLGLYDRSDDTSRRCR